jgi:hypothetical protein
MFCYDVTADGNHRQQSSMEGLPFLEMIMISNGNCSNPLRADSPTENARMQFVAPRTASSPSFSSAICRGSISRSRSSRSGRMCWRNSPMAASSSMRSISHGSNASGANSGRMQKTSLIEEAGNSPRRLPGWGPGVKLLDRTMRYRYIFERILRAARVKWNLHTTATIDPFPGDRG